jgi:TolA-binding protein
MSGKIWIVVAVSLLATANLFSANAEQAELEKLKAKVAELEKRVSELEKLTLPLVEQQHKKQFEIENRKKLSARVMQDRKKYTQEQTREIETLYQVANRNWRNPSARDKVKESLDTLITKYPDANRSGCAMLYLAQLSKNKADAVKILNEIITKYSNCWYGDGVQAGAYARFMLGCYYLQEGNKTEAEKYFNEIRKDYPGAVDHRGRLLTSQIPKQ